MPLPWNFMPPNSPSKFSRSHSPPRPILYVIVPFESPSLEWMVASQTPPMALSFSCSGPGLTGAWAGVEEAAKEQAAAEQPDVLAGFLAQRGQRLLEVIAHDGYARVLALTQRAREDELRHAARAASPMAPHGLIRAASDQERIELLVH